MKRPESALDDARRLPGVIHAEPLLSVACDFQHGPHLRKGSISGLDPAGRLTIPRDVAGNPLKIPETGLMMTRKLAEILHLQVGDEVLVTPSKGLRRTVAVPVVSINDSYLGLSVYADIQYLSRIIEEDYVVSGVQLELQRETLPQRVLYSEFCREVKRLPSLQGFNERAANVRNLRETFVKMQETVILLIVAFAGIIFFSSLLNTSLISFAERKREIGTLRVLGYTPWQIGGYFLRESMTLNLIGTVLGLPVGYALVWYMTAVYNTDMFRFPLIIPPIVFAKTFGCAVLFGSLAHVWVQSEIHHMDWRDALNVKE